MADTKYKIIEFDLDTLSGLWWKRVFIYVILNSSYQLLDLASPPHLSPHPPYDDIWAELMSYTN